MEDLVVQSRARERARADDACEAAWEVEVQVFMGDMNWKEGAQSSGDGPLPLTPGWFDAWPHMKGEDDTG